MVSVFTLGFFIGKTGLFSENNFYSALDSFLSDKGEQTLNDNKQAFNKGLETGRKQDND